MTDREDAIRRYVQYADDNSMHVATRVRIDGDMSLAAFVAGRLAMDRAADKSPAEGIMVQILSDVAADVAVIYGAPITIEPQKPILDGKYRADWVVTAGKLSFVLEVDGFAYHSDQVAFQRDRQRDRDIAATGLDTMRFTAKELLEHRWQVKSELFEKLLGMGTA